ncbi:hypothetical protein D3C77_512870 [compost metagenome]
MPTFSSASLNSGLALRPSWFKVNRLSSVAEAPSVEGWVAYSATAMPSAGHPCMVSSTCVVNPMMSPVRRAVCPMILWLSLMMYINCIQPIAFQLLFSPS